MLYISNFIKDSIDSSIDSYFDEVEALYKDLQYLKRRKSKGDWEDVDSFAIRLIHDHIAVFLEKLKFVGSGYYSEVPESLYDKIFDLVDRLNKVYSYLIENFIDVLDDSSLPDFSLEEVFPYLYGS